MLPLSAGPPSVALSQDSTIVALLSIPNSLQRIEATAAASSHLWILDGVILRLLFQYFFLVEKPLLAVQGNASLRGKTPLRPVPHVQSTNISSRESAAA